MKTENKIAITKSNRRRTLWMKDALWERVESAAKAEERTISSWIRRVVEMALEGNP